MTAANPSRAGEASGPFAPTIDRSEAVFKRAQRHSRRVRFLKYMLPALALVGVGGFIGWSYLSLPDIAGIDVSGAAISDGKLVMANPKLDGFTKDKLPYSMRATRAIQDLGNTDIIRLEEIDAKLPVDPKTSAKIVASTGVYDNGKNRLTIDSDLTVTTTDGMTANLKSADMDMDTGTMTTSDPVEILMNGSTITALSMNMTDNGKVIVFENRVRVHIEPKKKSEAAGDANNAVN